MHFIRLIDCILFLVFWGIFITNRYIIKMFSVFIDLIVWFFHLSHWCGELQASWGDECLAFESSSLRLRLWSCLFATWFRFLVAQDVCLCLWGWPELPALCYSSVLLWGSWPFLFFPGWVCIRLPSFFLKGLENFVMRPPGTGCHFLSGRCNYRFTCCNQKSAIQILSLYRCWKALLFKAFANFV